MECVAAFVALALSDEPVWLDGGGGASEACEEAEVEDVESPVEVKSDKNVVRAFDSRPSWALTAEVEDDDGDEVDEEELAASVEADADADVTD